MKYPDGNWYKPSAVLERASNIKGRKPLYNEHTGKDVGYVTEPAWGKGFNNGKIVRDFHYEKNKLSHEEERQLITGEKADVSMGFDALHIKTEGVFGGEKFDGIQTDLDIDHYAWTQKGRCSEADGCGLRVTDSVRYDSVVGETDGNDCPDCYQEYLMKRDRITDSEEQKSQKNCVGAKIKVLKKEHPDWEQDKITAAAHSYCKKNSKNGKDKPKDKDKDKEKKGDSEVSDPDGTDPATPEFNAQEAIEEIKTQFTEQLAEITNKITELTTPNEPSGKGGSPSGEPIVQTPPPTPQDNTNGKPTVTAEVLTQVLTGLNDLSTKIGSIEETLEAQKGRPAIELPLRGSMEKE